MLKEQMAMANLIDVNKFPWELPTNKLLVIFIDSPFLLIGEFYNYYVRFRSKRWPTCLLTTIDSGKLLEYFAGISTQLLTRLHAFLVETCVGRTKEETLPVMNDRGKKGRVRVHCHNTSRK